MAAIDKRWTECLEIIADEIGVDVEDIHEQDDFAGDLGVNAPLSRTITARLRELVPNLPVAVLEECPTVESLYQCLSRLTAVANGKNNRQSTNNESKPNRSRVPLSVILQGNPATSTETIFLLPDGSGSGMAYAGIPPISPSTCLIAMNSPYLRCPEEYRCSIQDMAREWAQEIRQRQPQGPYILGGWSAGGYYSYEVAENLRRQGEHVSKLILLDSPCRPDFEELPIQVVEYLSAHGLMGNWGVSERTPAWLVEHFRSTLRAVRQYVPTPMVAPPTVYVIWSADGVMREDQLESTGLDLQIKVSRFLLVGKPNFTPHGWERLFPGGKLYTTKIYGNHFTLISPPNVSLSNP
ncbi:Alpha/Beta hydrolase protein [Penicillium angulare]|uniref:Alpha/Beta hydrolase protein n=1 Tax=Penicillium angulare TaxID=116970 RepID=A0A9W9JZN0_9EURO|nr:Alpha/Beta hydrolase protein [Penicillium angulare]